MPPKSASWEAREVRGRVQCCDNGRWVEVCLWTSLSPRRAGAVRISLCQECIVALFMVLQASLGLMDASAQGELVRRVRAQISAVALSP